VYTKQLKEYDSAFEEIKEQTGLTKIDEIIKEIIERETRNRSLYNHLTEITKEVNLIRMRN